jgi:hypothetical protein
VEIATTAEYVARGACVQAVAALTGRDVATVTRDWAPTDTRLVDPNPSVDAAAVRDAYRTVRLHTYPESGATS